MTFVFKLEVGNTPYLLRGGVHRAEGLKGEFLCKKFRLKVKREKFFNNYTNQHPNKSLTLFLF